MQKYVKVETRTCGKIIIRALSDRAKLVFFFILTHPNMQAFGGMQATLQGLTAEMKWPLARFRKICQELEQAELLYFSQTAPLFWLPQYATTNKPETLEQMQTLTWQLHWAPDCELKLMIIRRLDRFYSRLGADYHAPFQKYFEDNCPDFYQAATQSSVSPVGVESPPECPNPEGPGDTPSGDAVSTAMTPIDVPFDQAPPDAPEALPQLPSQTTEESPVVAEQTATPVEDEPQEMTSTPAETPGVSVGSAAIPGVPQVISGSDPPVPQQSGERCDPKFVAESQQNEIPPETIPIPPSLRTRRFKKAWAKWLAHWREQNWPLTRWGIEQQLNLLTRRGSHAATQDIEYSIAKGLTMIEWHEADKHAVVSS